MDTLFFLYKFIQPRRSFQIFCKFKFKINILAMLHQLQFEDATYIFYFQRSSVHNMIRTLILIGCMFLLSTCGRQSAGRSPVPVQDFTLKASA